MKTSKETRWRYESVQTRGDLVVRIKARFSVPYTQEDRPRGLPTRIPQTHTPFLLTKAGRVHGSPLAHTWQAFPPFQCSLLAFSARPFSSPVSHTFVQKRQTTKLQKKSRHISRTQLNHCPLSVFSSMQRLKLRLIRKILQFWQRTDDPDNLPTGVIAFCLLQKGSDGCLLAVSHP